MKDLRAMARIFDVPLSMFFGPTEGAPEERGHVARAEDGADAVFGGGRVQSHDDHRIAMSFAVAALTGVAGTVEIDDPACAVNDKYRQQLAGWTEAPDRHYRGQLAIGEYYNVSGYKCLPICYMHTMANDIPAWTSELRRQLNVSLRVMLATASAGVQWAGTTCWS